MEKAQIKGARCAYCVRLLERRSKLMDAVVKPYCQKCSPERRALAKARFGLSTIQGKFLLSTNR